ncbi:DUF7344 domain-containing protein [Salinigranum sp. GCM10025319]|uniref:DUF7344 domain-containing protein n=1 Tax=Salinigranum sp. GCM10025319 TaxID=3252687 RepID=UPI0036187702
MRHTTLTDTHTVEATAPPGEVEADSTRPRRLSKNVRFEILQNQRRRDALSYLRANEGTATLGELAEYIAAKENGIDARAVSSSQRKRVYIGLYQCHLPKLAGAGVVDFDKNRGDVVLRPEAAQLDAYLDDEHHGDAARSPPIARNLAVAGGLGAGVVASLVGVPGFALVPDAAWALLSVGALVVLTVLDARRTADRD